MKANELRIGNLIYVDSKLRYVFGTIYKTIQHNYNTQNSTYSENYENECEPIPITEEWLLKFGFEVYEFDNKENQYRFKDRLIVIRDNNFHDYGTSVKLKSVHQLQNLYFALTNEELTIK